MAHRSVAPPLLTSGSSLRLALLIEQPH